MRISSQQINLAGLSSLQSQEAEVAKQQSEISSGVRVQTPSDDPLAAAQAERARSRIVHAQLAQRNAQLSTSVLAAADSALSQGTDILQRTRDLLVSAADPSYSAQDRQSMATEIQGLRDQLLQAANTSDGAGGYVFGGQGANSAPMSLGSQPGYGPAAGEQHIGEGGTLLTSVDGRATFISIPQGNGVFTTTSAAGNAGSGWIDTGSVTDANALTGHSYSIAISNGASGLTYDITDTTTGTAVVSGAPYTNGNDIVFDGQRVKISGTPVAGDSFTVAPAQTQSIFQTLDSAISLLQNNSLSDSAYTEQLQRVQVNVDRGLDSVIQMRTHVGEAANSADEQQSEGASTELAATQRRSDLRDVDMASAITKLQGAQTGLNAALQAYSTVSRKSLFDFLG